MDEQPQSNQRVAGNCLVGTIIGLLAAIIILGGAAYLIFVR